LPAFSKIYERSVIRIYKDKLISFFGANQHAFRPTASTTTAITYYHDIVSKFLDSNCKGVRIIAFDLAKAFDSVNHDLLIKKNRQ
jgi:retron-type reverse transcriptase